MAHEPTQPDTPPTEPSLPEPLVALLRERLSAERATAPDEPGVEPRIDDAVRRAARAHLETIDPPKPLRFPTIVRAVTGVGLAAAAIGLVVWFGPATTPTPAPPASNPGTVMGVAPEDSLARNGTRGDELAESTLSSSRMLMDMADAPTESDAMASVAGRAPRAAQEPVTIRDAFVLALALDAGETPDSSYDENSDGVVNEDDITALARTAVRLGDVRGFGVAPPWYTPTLGVFLPFALTNGSVMP